MFTRDEAVAFLENSWGVVNVEERIGNDRKNLVDEIVTLVLAKVPFQSITLMASPEAERKCPSYEDIRNQGMSGVGGLCYNINMFIWGLLRGLGFSLCLCRSTVTSTVTSSDNHLIILVTSLLKDGDVYLVDCGTGFPVFRAVPLDFDEESPVYQDGFLEYKYVRHDGKILRMHGKGDLVKRNDPPIEGLDFFLGRWRRFYSFVPDLSGSEKSAQDVHYRASVVLTPFTKSPRALWFPGKRAVVIVHNRLLIETEAGRLEPQQLESDEEIQEAYRTHFPALEQDAVKRAIAEWRRVTAQ